MASTPDHITITVDEVALREQVRKAVREELREVSRRLHMAADVIDPTATEEMAEYHREEGRKEAREAALREHTIRSNEGENR